jgi:hypothetical protein
VVFWLELTSSVVARCLLLGCKRAARKQLSIDTLHDFNTAATKRFVQREIFTRGDNDKKNKRPTK